MLKEIYLAGGCFWGLEAYLKRLPGVVQTQTGYANGRTESPTYQDVCHRHTGHAETVKTVYQPEILSLALLLKAFFRVIDPTSENRQGWDIGEQYRTGIYYLEEEDLPVIWQAVQQQQKKYEESIVTQVERLENFYLAEDYHQNYLEKYPAGYCHIHLGEAEAFIEEEGLRQLQRGSERIQAGAYQRPADEILRENLTDIQYHVTQNGGTELPYQNEYDRHFEKGIYVDVTTGEPLFASSDKFQSGCGWPAFTKPIAPEVLREKMDTSYGMLRTEVRSRAGDAHLGHVFEDGPVQTGGLRYCINCAALRFVAYEDMEREGYGNLKELVK